MGGWVGGAKGKQKLKLRPRTDTSSDTTTIERSNSRSVSASSASSCKLINSIREKRERLRAQQPSNSVRDDERDGISNVVHDSGTPRGICEGTEPPSVFGVVRTSVGVNVDDSESRDTVVSRSSTRDDCCCSKGAGTSFSSADLLRLGVGSLPDDSTIARLNFSVCDNSELSARSCSRLAIYPPEASAGSSVNDDASSSDAIRDHAERRWRCRGVDHGDSSRRSLRENERGGCTARDTAVVRSPRSIRANYYRAAEEYFADDDDDDDRCEKRLKENSRDRSEARRDDGGEGVREEKKRRTGVRCEKPPGRSCTATSCCHQGWERRAARRRWSACSCIAEEEEEVVRCANVDGVEGTLAEESLRDDDDEKISLNGVVVGERCGKIRARDAPRGSARGGGGTPENSEEPPQVTGVRDEFVAAEGPARDDVRGTTFAAPKGGGGPPQVAVTIGEENAPPEDDSEAAPEESVCKILGTNFAERRRRRRRDEGAFLNDAKDKLAKERTREFRNFDARRSDVVKSGEKTTTTVLRSESDERGGVVVWNDFTRRGKREDADERDERARRNASSDRASEEPSSSSRNVRRSAALTTRDRPNRAISNRDTKEATTTSGTTKTLADRRRTARARLAPLYRAMRSRVRYFDKRTKDLAEKKRDLTSGDGKRVNGSARKKSNEEDGEKRGPKEEAGRTAEDVPKDTLLRRSFKRLIDVIGRRDEARAEDRTSGETEKIESVDVTAANQKGKETVVTGSTSASEGAAKISDETGRRDVGGRVYALMRSPFLRRQAVTRPAVQTAEGPVPIAPIAADLETIPEERREGAAVSGAAAPKSRLLRVIAARRSSRPPPSIVAATTAEPAVKPEVVVSVPLPPVEMIDATNARAYEPREKIPREPSAVPPPAKVTEAIISAIERVPGDDDVEDADGREAPSQDAARHDEGRTKLYVACPRRGCLAVSRSYREITRDPHHDRSRCVRERGDNILFEEEEEEEDCSAQCPQRTLRPTRTTDVPRFRGVASSSTTKNDVGPRICADGECECGKTHAPVVVRSRRRRRRRCRCCCCCGCAGCGDRSRAIECKRKSSANCVESRGGPRDECRRAATALGAKRYERLKRGCAKTMICLYCDKPRDRCVCRAPIGRCSRCGSPSDVCDCRGDDRDRERIVGEPNEDRARIRVTSWRPRGEIRRYFARDLEESPRDREEYRFGREKPKRRQRRPDELPYQRLNVFSDVMNELQQKMSESVCCTLCERTPCRCGTQRIDRDGGKGEGRVKDYVKCPEVKRRRSESPDANCRCGSSPRDGRRNVRRPPPIRRIGCVCKLSPCGCGRSRAGRKRPLAKCYYCKSLPCA